MEKSESKMKNIIWGSCLRQIENEQMQREEEPKKKRFGHWTDIIIASRMSTSSSDK